MGDMITNHHTQQVLAGKKKQVSSVNVFTSRIGQTGKIPTPGINYERFYVLQRGQTDDACYDRGAHQFFFLRFYQFSAELKTCPS